MKSLSKLVFGVAFLALSSFLFTSCDKQNIDVIEEVVEENPEVDNATMEKVYKNGVIQMNAYASYCNANGKEYMAVSNNQLLINDVVSSADMNDGDFVIYYEMTPALSSPNNLALWTVDSTQVPNAVSDVLVDQAGTLSFSADTTLNTVKGTMSGSYVSLFTGAPSGTYTVNFNANIVQQFPLCN